MADRIDHAARAEAILGSFSKSVSDTGADTADMDIEEVAAWQSSMGLVLARATVEATLAMVEQLRIANRLKVAELDLCDEIGYRQNGGYALDFRIRPYLDADDWASIEVVS